MPFGELGAVCTMHQRNMREDRQVPAHGGIDLCLSRGIGEMIDAADHMRDAHVVIIDDDGEIVDRRAIRSQNDHVVEVLVRHHNAALHLIFYHRLTVALGFQPNHRLDAGGRGLRVGIAPWTDDDQRPFLGFGFGTHGSQLIRR